MVSLEEVIGSSASDVRFSATRGRIKLKEGVFQLVVQFHNPRLVSASVTIIGGRENGHHVSVVAPVVSFHDELVVNPLEWLNVSEMSCPNVYPAPRGEIPIHHDHRDRTTASRTSDPRGGLPVICRAL